MPIGAGGPTSGAGRKHFRTYEDDNPEQTKAAKQPRFMPDESSRKEHAGERADLKARKIANSSRGRGDKRKTELLAKVSQVRVHDRFLNEASREQLRDRLSDTVHDFQWFKGWGDKTLTELLPKDLNTRVESIKKLQQKKLLSSADENGHIGSLLIQHLNELEEHITRQRAKIDAQPKGVWDHLVSWYRGDHNAIENVTQQLLYWITSERYLASQVAYDPGATACAGRLDWNAAMEFRRLGYNLDPHFTVCGKFTDEHIAKRADAITVAGKGVRNTCYKILYNIGGKIIPKVFKPVDGIDASRWQSIVTKKDYFNPAFPHFVSRNMAVRKIAERLGMPELAPEVKFAIHNGQLGMVMSVAPGKTSRHRFHFSGSMRDVLHGYGSPKIHAEVMNGLNRMEWFDALCAQPDRHMENSMVSKKTGRVTTIDNDYSLYPMSTILRKSASYFENDYKQRAGCRVGYPFLIGRETLQSLKSLDIQGLQRVLSAYLSPDELKALESRYNLLLKHALGLEQLGMVVDNWNTWRDKDTGLSPVEYLQYVEKNHYRLQLHTLPDRAKALAKGRDKPNEAFLQSLPRNEYLKWQAIKNLQETVTDGAITSYFSDARRNMWTVPHEEFSDNEGDEE